ncbi:MAG: glycosyltransferase [Candidatus Hydrogenedentes bacterium]|nr:glycosyltransferase [Candidatus Hydrogenedentota bacterium]
MTEASTSKTREPRRVIIVLPTYNEEGGLGRLLDRIDEAMFDAGQRYEVIVVDDGSTDTTRSIAETYAKKYPISLEHHAQNQGLGATIRDGIIAAAKKAGDRDIIVTMDADDTHTPGLILRMVRMIQEGHDVVIASRYQPGAQIRGLSLPRRCISYVASIVFRVLLPIPGVKDFTCGFRAYRGSVIKEALAAYGDHFVEQEGFQCMVDILLKLRHMNLLFGEVPLVLRYDYKEGSSKMNVGKTIRNTLLLIVRRRFLGQR